MIKAILFLAFVAGALYIIRFTQAEEFFTPQALNWLQEEAGDWAPLAYILIYSRGVLACPRDPSRGLGRMALGLALLPQSFLFRGPLPLFFLHSEDHPEDKKRKNILRYGYTGMKDRWSGGCFSVDSKSSGSFLADL